MQKKLADGTRIAVFESTPVPGYFPGTETWAENNASPINLRRTDALATLPAATATTLYISSRHVGEIAVQLSPRGVEKLIAQLQECLAHQVPAQESFGRALADVAKRTGVPLSPEAATIESTDMILAWGPK